MADGEGSYTAPIVIAGTTYFVNFSDDARRPGDLIIRTAEGHVIGLPDAAMRDLFATHAMLHGLPFEEGTSPSVPLKTKLTKLTGELAQQRNTLMYYRERAETALNDLGTADPAKQALGLATGIANDAGSAVLGALLGIALVATAPVSVPAAIGGVVIATGLGALDDLIRYAAYSRNAGTAILGLSAGIAATNETLDEGGGLTDAVKMLGAVLGVGTVTLDIATFKSLEGALYGGLMANDYAISLFDRVQELTAEPSFSTFLSKHNLLADPALELTVTGAERVRFKTAYVEAVNTAIEIGAALLDGSKANKTAAQISATMQEGIAGAARGNASDFAAAKIEALQALADAYVIHGADGNDTILGSAGADSIRGAGGSDSIVAGGGNDIVDGGAGFDLILPGLGTDRIIVDAGDVISGTVAELRGDIIVGASEGLMIEILFDDAVARSLTPADFVYADGRLLMDLDRNGSYEAWITLEGAGAASLRAYGVTNWAGGAGLPASTVLQLRNDVLGFTIDQPFYIGLAGAGPASLGLIGSDGFNMSIGSTGLTAYGLSVEVRNLAFAGGSLYSVVEADAGENLIVEVPPMYSNDRAIVLLQFDPVTGAVTGKTQLAPDFGERYTESINALAPLGGGAFLAIGEFNFRTGFNRTLEGGDDFVFRVRTDGSTQFLLNLGDGASTRIVSADTAPDGRVYAWRDDVSSYGGGTLLRINPSTGATTVIANLQHILEEITSIAFNPDGSLIGIGSDASGYGALFRFDLAGQQVVRVAYMSGGIFPEEFDTLGSLAPAAVTLARSSGGLLRNTAQAELLQGSLGNDTIVAGADDTLSGGLGRDTATYGFATTPVAVDLRLTNAQETGGGGRNTLGGIENLIGGRAADALTGDDLANHLAGNEGDDRLDGNGGDDTLEGGAGADTLAGGAGNDTYTVDNVGDRVIEASGAGTDLVLSSVSFSLSGRYIENLTLTGMAAINGTGNTLANRITGNSAANVINGGAGADTLAGGAGNDTYTVDNVGDRVIEASGAGTDLVLSSVSFSLSGRYIENLTLTGMAAINGTGNTLANRITGNSAANVINGGAGADIMAGGAGNDTYAVDNAGDRVIEASGAGTDLVLSSVSFSLSGRYIENLTLTGMAVINGTGNTLANRITGNSAANVINGGAGADTMAGGAGNDTYAVDNAGDRVIEASGAGTDLVLSSVSFSLSGQHIENLTLTGMAAINGTGNSLANRIIGNSAANVINGGMGADTMQGGAGDDIYTVDNAGDRVIEASGAGTDLVLSSMSFNLSGQHIENLTLTGTAVINGTGNSLTNRMLGNSAANLLDGLGGNDSLSGGSGNDTVRGNGGADTLTGGAGSDTFRFLSADEANDIITDYASSADKIEVSAAGFGGGLLAGMNLTTSGRYLSNLTGLANAERGQFIFEMDARTLWWDVDGTGAGGRLAVASFTGLSSLVASELVVIA
jgi:Ca2+-binding RTX toxin-like protein